MTTATNSQTNTESNGTNAAANGKTKPSMNAVDAIGKIGKILDQLSPNDRKRVLNFHLESNGE